jgi:hypothetical protein
MDSRRKHLLLLLVLILSLAGACTRSRLTPKPPEETFPVDPVFQDFYKQHGGRNVLGPAISPPFTPKSDKDKIYQYLVNGLLMYDRQAPEGQRVSLGPVGRDFNVIELPRAEQPLLGEYIQNGHSVFERFVPLYEWLGGEAFTGKPLTGGFKNVEKRRYEQYFENLGFYWLDGDQEDAIHLLPYGAYKCGRSCAQVLDSAIYDRPRSSVPSFVEKAALLGLDFTGLAISEPVNQEGLKQQIYQNVVFTADQSNLNDVRLVAVPEVVGKNREAPRPPSPAPDMEFYAVEDTLGYNVPKAFSEYIQAHGGFEFVGAPINHVSGPDETSMEQCYTGLCLLGEIDSSGEVGVSVLPLGLIYRDIAGPRPQLTPIDNPKITVDEKYPMISSDQEQEIWVVLLNGATPVTNVEPQLTLTLPDGTQQIYRMPATDENGESRQRIPPLNAPNGTLVPYEVCVQLQIDQRFCVGDSYLIWPVQTITITPTAPPDYYYYLPLVIKNATMYVPALLDRFITYLPFLSNQH